MNLQHKHFVSCPTLKHGHISILGYSLWMRKRRHKKKQQKKKNAIKTDYFFIEMGGRVFVLRFIGIQKTEQHYMFWKGFLAINLSIKGVNY